MNELKPVPDEKSPRRFFSWRKLIYLMAAAGVATAGLVMLPPESTVRLALHVTADSHSAMRVVVPEKCRISAFYLRVRGPAPEKGELFVLQLNDRRSPVGDLSALHPAKVAPEAGTRNFLLPAELPPGTAGAVWKIGYDKVCPGIGPDALELVVEVTGPSAQVEHWSEIVSLGSKE